LIEIGHREADAHAFLFDAPLFNEAAKAEIAPCRHRTLDEVRRASEKDEAVLERGEHQSHRNRKDAHPGEDEIKPTLLAGHERLSSAVPRVARDGLRSLRAASASASSRSTVFSRCRLCR